MTELLIMKPDLGGTNVPFSREVTHDRTTYIVSNKVSTVKITIPIDKDSLHLVTENLKGDRFLEAHYDSIGDLKSANLWFRNFCDNKDFIVNTNPGKEFLDIYDKLTQRKNDLMFEIDLSLNKMTLYMCQDDSTSDNIKVIAENSHDMTPGQDFMSFCFEGAVEGEFITFFQESEDGTLTLGLAMDNKSLVCESLSMFADPKKILGQTTPKDVYDYATNVFVLG